VTRRLSEIVPRAATLVLDTSVLIAYLGGREAISPLATTVLDEWVRHGRNWAVVSAISAAELMVWSERRGREATAEMTSFLLGFEGISIRSADFLVAAEAARIRAETSATMPDALIAATVTLAGADRLLTNDRALRDRLRLLKGAPTVLLLSDFTA
jgi:predicted nucleic acid-binding protein